jgi:hypothetical protein
MATSVQIELLVDERGAVSGIRSFDTAVKGSTGSVRQLNTEMQRMSVAAPPLRWSKAVKEIGDHALTSLDNVRLLRDDLGIRIPRSMEKAIASSKVLSTAIGGIGQGLLAVGAIQIGASVFRSLIDEGQKVWNHFQLLTKASQDYIAEVEKTRNQEFGNARSIETTRLRIDEATEAIKEYKRQAEAAQKAPPGWRSVVPVVGPLLDKWHQSTVAGDLSSQAYDKQRQLDRLNQVGESSQYHEHLVGGIEAQHAGDDRLTGQKKITAEFQKRRDLAAETRRYENEQDRIQGNSVAPDAGADKESLEVKSARKQMEAQEFAEGREHAQELAHMRQQALEAGLSGIALYHAQESAAIEDLKFKDMDSVAARQAVHTKFHNEELKRLQEENRAIAKMREETQLAGMTGIARIQQEGSNKLADVYARTDLNPGQRLAAVNNVKQQTDAEIVQAQQTFAEQVDAIAEQSQNREMTGFARIRADAEKTASELMKQFDRAHSGMDLSKPGAQATLDADTAKLGTGLNAIGAGADRQSAELAQRNSQQTVEIEEDARIKSLSAEKQKTAAIKAEYDKRLEMYQEELSKQEISEDDFNRRVAAAAEERDAEMVEASREAHEKMASQFDSLFKSLDHPLKALESMGDKVAGNAAASLVQYVQGRGHGGSAGTQQGGFLGILGGFQFGKKKPLGVGADQAAETGPHAAHGASTGTFTIAQAVIRVGSASFAGGGGSGGGSGSSGGGSDFSGGGFSGAGFSGGGSSSWMSPAGGTSLLSSSGVNFSGDTTGSISRAAMNAATRPAFGASGSTGSSGSISFGGGASSGGSSSYAGGGGGAGGAGDSSVASASPHFAGGGGPAVQGRDPLGSALGGINSGIKFAQQANSIFGKKGQVTPAGAGGDGTAETQDDPMDGSMNADGSFSAAGSGSGLTSALGTASGLAGGALGMYSAVKGNGGFGGAAQGAMSGMQLGMIVGGPMGAAIGAAAGAVVGAIGFGGREKARVYDLKNVRPTLTADQDAYAQGSMDYMTAYSNAQQMIGSSWGAIRSMGPAAMSYWNDTIKPELTQAMAKFTSEERAGRSLYPAAAASYAVGTDYIPTTGFNLNHQGERIMPSDQNERITRAVESGADLSSVHKSYQQAMRTGSSQGSSGPSRTMNMNVHAIDSSGVAQFLDKYKHQIRGAVNDSYAENSGGGL